MGDKRTSSFIFICLACLILEARAQKNGFRGGSKSYEVHVEASTMGTNLHYELPESKVKAVSKQDWQVDNDNAEMLAMNSPVLATVNVKHPKFSMKGQWPEYKTSFKLPKDVSEASKRTDFLKFNHRKHQKIGKKLDQHEADLSGGAQALRDQPTTKGRPAGSGDFLSKLAGRLLRERKLRQEGGLEMSKITRLLLPIAGLKDVDLNNPHVSNAMKGVIKHARKVVDEAKTVLNDAANFVTKVRKLVKVTKDHSKKHREVAKASAVAKETSPTRQTDSNSFATHEPKDVTSSSKERSKMNDDRLKKAANTKENDLKSRRRSMGRNVDAQKNNITAKHSSSQGDEEKLKIGASAKGVEKRSYLDSLETKRKSRVHRRGLAETLESILSTINGLKSLSKYH